MKPSQILEDNELIAVFMQSDSLPRRYDYDWNWLMPVIEKICNLWRENIDQHNTPPKDQREADMRFSKVGMLSIDCGIEAAYINVVEFIKWHNSQ